MSCVLFIDPDGMTKDCATKKMRKSTMMIVPVHELENLYNADKNFFTYALCFADLSVLESSIAMVMGPTPPGTGVM